MKKTIIKICCIFLLIVLYSALENWLFCRFVKETESLVALSQKALSAKEIESCYRQINDHLDDNQLLIWALLPKNEMEMIDVSLGRMKDYLNEGQLFEARVAAGEVSSYLRAMGDGMLLEK